MRCNDKVSEVFEEAFVVGAPKVGVNDSLQKARLVSLKVYLCDFTKLYIPNMRCVSCGQAHR